MDPNEAAKPNGRGMRIGHVADTLPGKIEGRPLPLAVARGLTPSQQKALNHRVRREILRRLSSARPNGFTAAELRHQMAGGRPSSASVISFHLGILSDNDALDVLAEGTVQRFKANQRDEPIVAAVLLATEAADALLP